jgi:predicted acyl esterase
MKFRVFTGILLLFLTQSLIFSQLRNHPRLENYNFQLLPKNTDVSAVPVQRTDFTITLRDGVIIDALKFVPQGTAPAGGWPTVIMVHGYGDNKETLAGFCQAQAEYGYYTMTFSMRGQGNSGGLSNLISTTEAQDMIEIANWVKSDSVNGSNPNNILIMGGSQGGMVPFMAACMGMKVKTLISALAPPNFASSWIENGCIKMTLLWTVEYTPDTARYTPQVDRMSDWIYANNKEKWDSLAYWLPQNRDFMNIVPQNTVPLIIEGSWQDKFFNASGIITSASLLTAPFRMYVGAVQGHGGDHSPTEDQWHMNFFNDWFFYWLFGVQNGTMTAPKYQYASTTYPAVNNYWTFVHDSSTVWPPANTNNWRLFFNKNGVLKNSANSTKGNTVSFNNKISGGLTMQEAVNEEFTGSLFNSKFKKNSVTFTTAALTSNVQMTGTPKINLSYKSTGKTFCQYNFQIYEVQPNGTQRLINRINYTDRNYIANSSRIKNIPGQAHSHIFKAGNRLRIVVTNLDTSPEDVSFLGTNPFVLPVLVNSTNYINLNSSTYIDIPVKGAAVLEPTADNDINLNPDKFELAQNYPNPFNPATTINYSIPSAGNISLKIYDIAGREVASLVNGYMESGIHSINFNAQNLSSGIYFYKLSAPGFTEVKKMVLVK